MELQLYNRIKNELLIHIITQMDLKAKFESLHTMRFQLDDILEKVKL